MQAQISLIYKNKYFVEIPLDFTAKKFQMKSLKCWKKLNLMKICNNKYHCKIHTKYYNKNITKKNNKNKNKKTWNNYIKIWLIIKSMKIKNNINNKIRTKKIIIRNYLIEKLFKIIIITVLTYIPLHLNIRFH